MTNPNMYCQNKELYEACHGEGTYPKESKKADAPEKRSSSDNELIMLAQDLAELVISIPHGIDPRIREKAKTLLRKSGWNGRLLSQER